jgi:hypothetical protein
LVSGGGSSGSPLQNRAEDFNMCSIGDRIVDDISRDEFNKRLSAAVRTTIGLLEDAALFEEELVRHLQEADPPLRRLTKKVIRASKERGDSYGQKFIPKHLGAIYGPAQLVKDVDDVEDDENQDDDADDGDEPGEVVLEPGSPYVFLKISFYDTHFSQQEPYILFGRIKEIASRVEHAPFTSSVKTKRNRLKHLLAAIHRTSAGRWVDTRARFTGKSAAAGKKTAQRLAIKLDDSIVYRALYDLRSEEGAAQVAGELCALLKSLSPVVRRSPSRHVKARR